VASLLISSKNFKYIASAFLYDFIWKKYSQHGYRTLYSEDAPGIQMFDYLKAGFSKFPADYFNRPFSLAAWDIFLKTSQGRLET
jgi:hypothetical protein